MNITQARTHALVVMSIDYYAKYKSPLKVTSRTQPISQYVFKRVMNHVITSYNEKEDNELYSDDEGDANCWCLRTLERIAHILMTFSKSDRTVKEGLVAADNGLSSMYCYE